VRLKSGRVLSADNFGKLKTAIQNLQEILDSAEPSEDTRAKSAEPQQHSALSAIHDIKSQLHLEQVARELRSVTAAMRGAV
jgi:hypothetical protein